MLVLLMLSGYQAAHQQLLLLLLLLKEDQSYAAAAAGSLDVCGQCGHHYQTPEWAMGQPGGAHSADVPHGAPAAAAGAVLQHDAV
jgi:hypothetical protein